MDTKILEQLEERFAEEITLAGNDLGLLEVLLKEKLQLLCKRLLRRLVNRGLEDWKCGFSVEEEGCEIGEGAMGMRAE